MSFIAPQPKNIIAEVIDEEAKFMKNNAASPMHADSLEVSSQPHIIESDNFFKLPIQETFQEMKQLETTSPVDVAAKTETPVEPAAPILKKKESYEEFIMKKKIEAG